MKSKKTMTLFLAVSMAIASCVLDISDPESESPTLDPASRQETEISGTRVFQEAVETSIAATMAAMPTSTPVPTETAEPTETTASPGEGTSIAESTRRASPDRFDIPIQDQPFLGPENAPIVIVEFSDFNCGYCKKWHLEDFQPLLDAYPGQIRFVYRDFPFLSEQSFYAAVAAQCAYEQDAFWGYHDELFTRSEPKGTDTYLLFAQELGLDIPEFQACVESERAQEAVIGDLQFASDLGVQGTPTFFINGFPVVGAQPLETFIAIIDDELGDG